MKQLSLLISSGLLLASAPLCAATYVGTRDVNGVTVNISITTDDTIGALSASNILDFDIGLSDVENNELNPTNSSFQLAGSSLVASAANLTFDFSQSDAAVAFFKTGSTAQYCLLGTGYSCFGQFGGEAATSGGLTAHVLSQGNQIIASVPTDVPAVPEPITWALMVIGFGGVGGLMRLKSSTIASFART
ncbi:MAG: PEPxxWA-CTERM sorting domain-containing protein [Sphingomonadaceae bacterium]